MHIFPILLAVAWVSYRIGTRRATRVIARHVANEELKRRETVHLRIVPAVHQAAAFTTELDAMAAFLSDISLTEEDKARACGCVHCRVFLEKKVLRTISDAAQNWN